MVLDRPAWNIRHTYVAPNQSANVDARDQRSGSDGAHRRDWASTGSALNLSRKGR